jgi:hypothetical protein
MIKILFYLNLMIVKDIDCSEGLRKTSAPASLRLLRNMKMRCNETRHIIYRSKTKEGVQYGLSTGVSIF